MKTEEHNITSLNEYLSFLDMHGIAKGIKQEKGYDIAGHMGIRVSEEKQAPHNMFGILKEKQPLEKSILGIKYKKPQRADLLGELWNEDEKFILKIYGHDNYLEVSKLIKKHLSLYGIKPEKFVYQDKRRESYLFDDVA
ncbi:MAG TPA: hypothetical protein PK357_01810 [Candidatus Pacearchaeota archaeon]|nr:hypothetical protein [Candidatus Pacearchaeota archaeon]